MTPLIYSLVIVYTCSLLGLWQIGLSPDPPYGFLLLLALVIVPFAYALSHFLVLMERWASNLGLWVPVIAISAGCLLTWIYRPGHILFQAGAAILLLLTVLGLLRERRTFLVAVALSLLTLVVGYVGIWNLNYLALSGSLDRLRDPALQTLDATVYAWLGVGLDYEGIFPLLRSPHVFTMLENAYLMLFAELFVVIFLLARHRITPTTFLAVVFACYLAGLAVFMLYPVVGPCIYYERSFDHQFRHTMTFGFMQSMAREFHAVSSMSPPFTGFGYFVGVPSLHVAMALLFQLFLRPWRFAFWMFLPINLMMGASTVLLGYHYILDMVGGVVLVLIVEAARHGAVAGSRRAFGRPEVCMEDYPRTFGPCGGSPARGRGPVPKASKKSWGRAARRPRGGGSTKAQSQIEQFENLLDR
jgi:membrane-associated phospholipid phosphatase